MEGMGRVLSNVKNGPHRSSSCCFASSFSGWYLEKGWSTWMITLTSAFGRGILSLTGSIFVMDFSAASVLGCHTRAPAILFLEYEISLRNISSFDLEFMIQDETPKVQEEQMRCSW